LDPRIRRVHYGRAINFLVEGTMSVLLNPQYVVDNQQTTKAVLLSVEEWKQVLEELEELEDIRAYDSAKSGSQESVLFEEAVQEIRGEYTK
jgi:hypothetical protein